MKTMKVIKNLFPILILSIVLSGGLFLGEQFFHISYGWQTLLKWILLFLVPFILYWKKESLVLSTGKFSQKVFLYGVPLGIMAALAIVIAYLKLQDKIDWSLLQSYLDKKHITATTFFLVFTYITFGNSFLEELFFRGWVFRTLSTGNVSFAYIFSALLFSLYHLSIFSTWFTGWILLLVLFGLFISGCLFSFLYYKTHSIWSAWIVHIFADTAIVVI
jgi:membrane protease YdiL (CAAX protease family)